jgi:F-type H+-transporting ATPase subunit epsilon
MKELILSVVTPERSIMKDTVVDSIVLPGEVGQMNLLPGHADFIATLRQGVFGYRASGSEWQIAFLSGGFVQVYGGKVTVLAETVEMAQELDLAKAEMEVQELNTKIKAAKVGTPEYADLVSAREEARSKLQAAKKKIH